MEQRHLDPEAPFASAGVQDSLLCEQGLIQEEEATTNVPAESAISNEATDLTVLLQQEARSRRKETWQTFAWSGAFLVLMPGLVRHSNLAPHAFMTDLLLCFALMMSLGLGMLITLCWRSYRRKLSLTHALSQIHARSRVGSLVQTLQVQNTSVRNLAKRSLIDLLPTLQASDGSLLGEVERKILLRQLAISPGDSGYRDLTELFSRSAYRREVDLRLSILKALEQVGGAKELAVVERLSRGLPTLYSASKFPEEIQAAAKACLPYLEVRANEQRASEQLLRASNVAFSPSGGMLLRPASTRADALPEQLLRASEPRSQ